MSERTAVYRLYGSAGGLLYVGITKRLGARWDEHAKAQQWWPEIDRLTVEWLPSREEAQQAEATAIKSELPRFNISHNVDAETGLPMIGRVIGNGDWRVSGRIGMTATRSDLTHVLDHVTKGRTCVFITVCRTPHAAVVPADLGEAIMAVGGVVAALKLLRPAD